MAAELIAVSPALGPGLGQMLDVGRSLGDMALILGAIMEVKSGVAQTWANAMFAGSAMANKPACPVFVCSDTLDGGTVVPVPFQQAYIAGIQALGGEISVKEYPNDDHFSLPTSCVSDAQAWMAKQFT